MIKRGLAFALSILMLLPMCLTAHAEYTPQYTAEAEILYDLGLFKGTGSNADGTPIFDLDKSATRIQGIIMLIRLLGEEEAALACTAQHPFTDVPTWANNYVAYAYEKKYTYGAGNNTFGSDDKLLGKAYVTFVLRALGYNDAAGDFSYNNALTFGAELGLITAGQCEGELHRDDTALVSYNALKTTLKDSDTKLIEKLEQNGAVTSEAVQKSGVLAEVVHVPFDSKTGMLNYSDVYDAIPGAILIGAKKIGVNKQNGLLAGYEARCSEMDFSLFALYISNSTINPYVVCQPAETGYIKLPDLVQKPERQAYITDGSNSDDFLSVITVLGDNYTLIAYSIVPPLYSGDTITFTLCNYNGMDEAEKIREHIKNIEKNTPEFSVDALSYEKIVTDCGDGTQKETYRLIIDESKLPATMKAAKYYSVCYKSMTISTMYGDIYTGAMLYKSGTFHNIHPVDAEQKISYFGNQRAAIFLYDENRNLIGYATTENGIRMN